MAASPATDDKAALQGIWIAQSMEADGKSAPSDTVKNMRFTFKGDKLLVRGNFDNEREEECSYEIDATKSPKHLDFTPPKEKKPLLAIYELKDDELKICIRHASSSEGRPDKFDTKPDSKLILLVLKKAKAETKSK
jgi:uncharacterized protein (TIGR03067 family)